jgi:hypothetical protein
MTACKEPAVLGRARPARLVHRGLGALQPQGCVGMEREEGALGRGKARGWPAPRTAVGDGPRAPVVVTGRCGHHPGVAHGPHGLAVAPQHPLRLGPPRRHLAVGAR